MPLTPMIGPTLGDRIRLRLLVIAAETTDPNLGAITALLDRIGTPYDIFIATKERLTERSLWHKTEKYDQAYYQGVILTTGNLLYWNGQNKRWESAFDAESWQQLWWYEVRFGIRQLTLYALGSYPETNGLQLSELINTQEIPLALTLTEEGQRLFWYLNPNTPVLVRSAGVYLAQPCDPSSTPLLLTAEGQTVATVQHHATGRETLALTMAHAPHLLHTLLLGYGLLNWVTRGLFLGERRVYLSIQIDDVFNRTGLWDQTVGGEGEQVYRLTALDAEAVIEWLNRVQQKVDNGAQLTLDLAFNGAGIIGALGNDALASTLLQHQARFRWINHGYRHLLLDQATYADSRQEIEINHQAALQMSLSRYEPTSMVTADLSGLENPDFLQAARDMGIRRLVSDTSKSGWRNPSPNTGIVREQQPEILYIPRYPTNLFYDVSTPTEWMSKYNYHYQTYWKRDLNLAEIIEQEADMVVRYLLTFDIDPLMFHQANLRAYDGEHSLLSDLIDRVLVKYNTFYHKVALQSLSMEEIGEAMIRRAAYDGTHIQAILICGEGLALRADQNVTVAVTGVQTTAHSTMYAGQAISQIPLQANMGYWIPAHNLVGCDLANLQENQLNA